MLHLVVLPGGYKLMLNPVVGMLYLISVYMYTWENVARLFPPTSLTFLSPVHSKPFEVSWAFCATTVFRQFACQYRQPENLPQIYLRVVDVPRISRFFACFLSTYQVCVLCFLSTSWLIYQISCFFCGQIQWGPILSMLVSCSTPFIMSIITPWRNTILSESSIRVFWDRHDAIWVVVWLTTSHQRFCLHHQGFCLDKPRI